MKYKSRWLMIQAPETKSTDYKKSQNLIPAKGRQKILPKTNKRPKRLMRLKLENENKRNHNKTRVYPNNLA